MENQKTIDARIWGEIVATLCAVYDITRQELYSLLGNAYPKWLEYGRDLFLDMNHKTFWREIPKAIRRRKLMLGIVPSSSKRSNRVIKVGADNAKEI